MLVNLFHFQCSVKRDTSWSILFLLHHHVAHVIWAGIILHRELSLTNVNDAKKAIQRLPLGSLHALYQVSIHTSNNTLELIFEKS